MWPIITRRVKDKTLLCPFCQSSLSLKDGELYCEKGNCGFSKHVTGLIESGLASARHVALYEKQLPAFTYGCPNCGSPLLFPEGCATCGNCGFASPRGLHFNLTERHYHREVL